MSWSKLNKWMKDNQIWGGLVVVVATGILGWANDWWSKKVSQVSYQVSESGLVDYQMAQRLGKKIELRVEGGEVQNAMIAAISFVNTGNVDLVAPEFVILAHANGKFVTWAVANENRVQRDGARGEILADRLKLQLPFLNAGDSVSVTVLSQGSEVSGVDIQTNTPGLRLLKAAPPSDNRTLFSTLLNALKLLAAAVIGSATVLVLYMEWRVKRVGEQANRIATTQAELRESSEQNQKRLDEIARRIAWHEGRSKVIDENRQEGGDASSSSKAVVTPEVGDVPPKG